MIYFYVHVKASFDLNVTREKGVNLNVILEKNFFFTRHNVVIKFTMLWWRYKYA